MRRDLLQLLAAKLRTVPADKFEITAWFVNWHPNDEADPCGFAGCAVGWACTMPEMQAAGLHRVGGTPVYNPRGFYPGDAEVFRDCPKGFNAAAGVFGLTLKESYRLFDPKTYAVEDEDGNRVYPDVTPAMVADRIDELLAAPVAAG